MNFGSYWGDIFQLSLNGDATGPVGDAYNIAYNSSGQHSIEGSFMFFHDEHYYLFFSSGQCCNLEASMPSAGNAYKIFACRSPSVNGPFVDQDGVDCTSSGGTLVLASHGNVFAPGGQGFFFDPAHGTVLYYHYGMCSQILTRLRRRSR